VACFEILEYICLLFFSLWVLVVSEFKMFCSAGGGGVATIKGKDFATADYSGENARAIG
jgi:hypothetical protein